MYAADRPGIKLAGPFIPAPSEDPIFVVVGGAALDWLLINTDDRSSCVSMKNGLNVMFTVAWCGSPVAASILDMNVCCTLVITTESKYM